jgi:hypothetical protein
MILLVSADAAPAQGGERAIPAEPDSAAATQNANRPAGICEQGRFVYTAAVGCGRTVSVSLKDGVGHRAAMVGLAPSASWAPRSIDPIRYSFSILFDGR